MFRTSWKRSNMWGIVRAFRVGAIFVLAFVFLAAPLEGQLTRGTISGTVIDPDGGRVPKVDVEIVNKATNISQETLTNEVGVYRFAAVEPGAYSIRFVASGFHPRIYDLTVVQAQDVVLNHVLALGTLATEVSIVVAPGTDLDKASPTISTTFPERIVRDLPITAATRDVTRLVVLAPTVTRAPGSNQFAANGQRARNNNFTIDGTDNNDLSVTLDSARLLPEAVAEFQIQTTSYSAEFGRNTGAQVNAITRSGTNQFHGEAWEFYRGSWMEPVSLTNKRADIFETPGFVHHQGGGSFGGPIVRDKAFFFGLAELNRRREAADARNAAAATIPTPAGYAALTSIPLGPGQTTASRNAVLSALTFLPEIHSQVTNYNNPQNVTINGVPVEVGTIRIPIANPSDRWYALGRFDVQATSKDRLTYRYFLDDRNQPDNAGNRNFGTRWTGGTVVRNQNHLASYTRVFPAFVNEARFAYVRGVLDFPERDPNSPTTSVTGFFTLGGANNFPQGRNADTFQWQNLSTLIRGTHSFKFGTDIRYNKLFNRSVFDFKGTFRFDTLQDFINNDARQLAQAVNEATFDARQWVHYYFFQDDWKATRDLTINLGIRYEYSSVPLGFFGATEPDVRAAGVPGPARPDKNNWAPRFGFAYSPSDARGFLGALFGDGRGVIRGGFGIGYDVLFYNILVVNASNYPRVVTSLTTRPETLNLYPSLASKTATVPPFNPLALFVNTPENIQNPTSHFWSLTLQRQLQDTYTFEIGYSGNRSYHGIRQGRSNPVVLTPEQAATVRSTGSPGSVPGTQARRLNPNIGERVTIESTAKGEYHAGFVRLEKRISRGLNFGANYTYSANFSDNDESLGEAAIAASSPQIPQDFLNYRNEWSRSVFDRPHRLSVNYLYDIPWFSGLNQRVTRQIFAGWHIGGFTEFQSGQPFTIRTGVDSAGNLSTAARPDFNPNGVVNKDPVTNNFRTFSIPVDGTGIVVAPLVPGTTTLLINSMSGGGNLGRNTFRGPGYSNWSISVGKTFDLTERVKFVFRTDFINAWNHRNFGNPVATMSSATFGQNTATPITESRNVLFNGRIRF